MNNLERNNEMMRQLFSMTLGELFALGRELVPETTKSAANQKLEGNTGILGAVENTTPAESPRKITRERWTAEDDAKLLAVCDASLDALQLVFPNRTRKSLIGRRAMLVARHKEGRLL